jgi:hypothetical protein
MTLIATSFDVAWTEAERAAFLLLCSTVGAVENKGGFLGRDFGIANSFWFTTGQIGGNPGGNIFYCTDFPTMEMPAYAELNHMNRSALQANCMKIIRALPVLDDANSNIHQFRIAAGGVSPIRFEYSPLANEPKPVPRWICRIDFDIVFTTGGKANSI